jgi:flagellar hook protein FlgE
MKLPIAAASLVRGVSGWPPGARWSFKSMGIFGALTTAVSGLRAQSFALENISGNIANSQTTAFKRVDTAFLDLIPDATPTRQLAGAVNSYSRGTNGSQGDIQSSSQSTYMAINGDGYFQVAKLSDTVDGNPVFSNSQYFTRRGDFELDRDGYMKNGAGYYLKALPIDPITGNPAGTVAQIIRFNNDFMAAQSTTEVEYRANLADYPLTTESDPGVPNSELLVASEVPGSTISTGIAASDNTLFLGNSIAGGAITVYDDNGAPANVQLRWAKLDSTQNGGTDTWNLFYLTNSRATGSQTMWRNVGEDYTFGSNGQMNPPVANVTLSGLQIDGVSLGDVSLIHGTTGMTQYSDPNGNAAVTQLRQNGYTAGEMTGVQINNNGRIVAAYTNGRTQDIAEIPLFAFNADNMLKRFDGGVFLATSESGEPLPSATGTIMGQSLEGSNADIADEFTKLIVTQQAYAANTRIVSTSDEMLSEVLQMVR